jgi:hypothetical protein
LDCLFLLKVEQNKNPPALLYSRAPLPTYTIVPRKFLLGTFYEDFIMTNEQQKPATPPTSNPAPTPQQNQGDHKPSNDKPGQPQQK